MKTIVVLGASRGIGFELVQQFLNAGDTVFCLTRNLEPLKIIRLKKRFRKLKKHLHH